MNKETPSAEERSADGYADIARMELRLASKATELAHFGTAETHRKNAAMAFDFETKLRRQSIE